MDEQRKYYEACVELARSKGWHATLCALVEDGYSDDVDWEELYIKWTNEEKNNE